MSRASHGVRLASEDALFRDGGSSVTSMLYQGPVSFRPVAVRRSQTHHIVHDAGRIGNGCGHGLLHGGDKPGVRICDLPSTESAVKASIALTKALGISFRTAPALPVEEFDKLVGG